MRLFCRRSPQGVGYFSTREIIHISRDGARSFGAERRQPAGHRGISHPLGNDVENLLGLVAVFPLSIGQISGGRTFDPAGDRAVAASRDAVAAHASIEINLASLDQQRIARDLFGRGTDAGPRRPVKNRPQEQKRKDAEDDPGSPGRAVASDRLPSVIAKIQDVVSIGFEQNSSRPRVESQAKRA